MGKPAVIRRIPLVTAVVQIFLENLRATELRGRSDGF